MKIVHKGWFAFFAAIYAISLLLLFCAASSPAIADARASDMLPVFASWLPSTAYDSPACLAIWAFTSFFEVLFILWQTDLKDQKLNRAVLAGEGINIVFTAIALAWMDGAVFTLILLGVLALILAVPAFIVVKLRKRNGAYDFSDIMGPEEHAAWKKMRQKRRSR